jgi:hypothetical protein
MAVFDANLMLRNTTTALSTTVTGSFVDLGLGGEPAQGLTIRANVNTANANADTLVLKYDFSDDGTNVQESVTLPAITGTNARSGNGVESLARTAFKRRYVRYVATVTGSAPNFGVVPIGVDAGEYAPAR